jgi:dTMP kinase
MAGKFITFEGGEGSGKSTQIRLLKDWLTQQGIDCITTYEPGGTVGADKVKAILTEGDTQQWDGISEVLLLYAARHDLITKIIQPALTQGTWVLCDRFSDSTFAYQGYGRGVDLNFIQNIHHLILGDFSPDLTLILDLDPAIGMERAKRRALAKGSSIDRFERQDLSFHNRLAQGFKDLAQKGDRYVLVDASQTLEPIQEDIQQIVQEQCFR